MEGTCRKSHGADKAGGAGTNDGVVAGLPGGRPGRGSGSGAVAGKGGRGTVCATTVDKVSEIDRRAYKVVSEDLDDLQGECLHFFHEELARDTTDSKNPAGATVAMSNWKFQVSVTVSRTGKGGGP